MSEDEIIKNIKELIQWSDHTTYKMALNGLLDLYQKEKDLNQELQIRYKIENDKYKEEKKKNKIFEDVINSREYTWKQKYEETFNYVKDEFVSKDKIREKIEDLEKRYKIAYNKSFHTDMINRLREIKMLKELLEEENNEM